VCFLYVVGKTVAVGRSRKWCPWEKNGKLHARRPSATTTSSNILGNGLVSGAGTAKSISFDTQFSDDGAAINYYYTTYFFEHDSRVLQCARIAKLLAYLSVTPKGQGT